MNRKIQLFKPKIPNSAIKGVRDVLLSGWIGYGPKVKEFEKLFAEYIGTKCAVATNSCTSALHLAVIASGIKEGDEVITTPLTFISTNNAILYERAIPVFADVNPATYNISPESIEKLITKKTKAIMLIHYGGYPAELDEIYSIAKKYNLKVIEDAAHACGSIYKGKKIGSFGTTCFSFQSVKNLTTADGGMLMLDDEEQYKRIKKLSWMGIDKNTYDRVAGSYAWQYDVAELGYKYNMNDVNAVIGIEQLKLLEEQNSYRRKLAKLYSNNINHQDIISLPKLSDDDIITSQHLYVIQAKRRNDLMEKLRNNGIETGVHYILTTDFPFYKKYKSDAKTAEEIVKNFITLPMNLFLTEKDILRISRLINGGW
jgi:perosamine synthetase